MAAVAPVRCARCLKTGHSNMECSLPFYRKFTDAELRQQSAAKAAARAAEQAERQKQKAERIAAWEQKKEEWEAKQAAWERRQAAIAERVAEKKEAESREEPEKEPAWKDDDTDSSPPTPTPTPSVCEGWQIGKLSTRTPSEADEVEVTRIAAANKEVRKLQKMLRDIDKLEKLGKLDILQKVKLEKRHHFENELTTALALAKAIARVELQSK